MFAAVLPGHRLIGVMLSVASIVLRMTYAIMPALTRVGAAWPRSDGKPRREHGPFEASQGRPSNERPGAVDSSGVCPTMLG